jgi:hypothetical protein
LVVIVAASFMSTGVTSAQDASQRYFQETGHWVSGDFLASYLSIDDPALIFGFPITEAFQSPVTGLLIQYFERAVFELHPENPPELRVAWKLIGSLSHQSGAVQVEIRDNFSACKTFDESITPFQVCYSFLTFFNENGGIAQFGYPISNAEYRNDRIVQWFQRARFEWYPDLEDGKEVVLADLGREYFTLIKEDIRRIESVPANNLPRVIIDLDVRGFFSSAVISPTGDQSLYVIVLDQKMDPLPDVSVLITLRYPSGTEVERLMPFTDANGITMVNIPIQERKQGIVECEIEVTYNNLEATTRSSFRIWW